MRPLVASAILLCSSVAACGPTPGAAPVTVSLCELATNAGRYDQRNVRVSGTVTRGFEGFTLEDPSCRDAAVWLDIGGTIGSGVMYCCGVAAETRREKPLRVQGLTTSVVNDALFRKFQEDTVVSAGYGRAQVTLIGPFFAGEQTQFPRGSRWVGFGHMGMFSLLVIERVVAVERLPAQAASGE